MNNIKKKKIFLTLIVIGLALLGNRLMAFNDAPLFKLDMVNMASEDMQLSRLEMYVKIVYSELQFIKSDEQFLAQYEVTAVVTDENDKQVDSQKYKDKVLLDHFEETESPYKFNLKKLSFELPPGKYKTVVQLLDLETLKSSQQKSSITLQNFSGETIAISDILFLDQYSKNEAGEIVFRPRVSNFKFEDSKLYAYLEVYNVPEGDSFQVEYEILNPEKQVMLSNQYWARSEGKISQNFIDILGEDLSHGKYMLKTQVNYKDEKAETEQLFNWYIEGLPLSFTDLNEAIDALGYIATKEQIEELKGSPDDEKHTNFLEFWEDRDPTPGTPENELRREYYGRIIYANEHFSGFKKDGWKTDMGWVYVMLGAPDTIEREPFNQDFATRPGRTIKAIEVWVYYQYNRQFLFFDEIGFGDFRLENPETLYEIIER